jgi:hypothetical protein
MWLISSNPRYADNACAIIRAWATTCTVFKGNNAPLEGGWGTDSLSRSAELLKHTYSGWTPQLEQQYVGWVRACVMPQLHKEGLWVHLPLANWQTTIGEAKAQFAILTGDSHRHTLQLCLVPRSTCLMYRWLRGPALGIR